jgi:hypothetical protein
MKTAETMLFLLGSQLANQAGDGLWQARWVNGRQSIGPVPLSSFGLDAFAADI